DVEKRYRCDFGSYKVMSYSSEQRCLGFTAGFTMKVQDVHLEIKAVFSNNKLNSKLMRTFFRPILGISIGAWLALSCTPSTKQADWDTMTSVFTNAPDSIQTSVYWYWISDNLSKEGVVKDLHAMKRAGINRAFIGNIGLDDLPEGGYGKVKLFTDEWWDILHTALKTATELDIEIGIFNSPGWSQSGGPWVQPNQAMRYLASADTLLEGGQPFNGVLPVPQGDFQRVNVLAFRVPEGYGSTLADLSPKIQAGNGQSPANLMDNNRATEVKVAGGRASTFTFSVDEPFTARSLTVIPAQRNMGFSVTLEVEDGGAFRRVRSFDLDRTNNMLSVGFEQYAPVSVSFEAT